MPVPANAKKTMLLLTYTPRADVSLDKYHQWLRDVDNPFFNSRPAVRHYTNWRVVEAKVGVQTFTHFDLLEVDGLDGFEKAFGDEKLVEFARNWVRLWGQVQDPDLPDQSVNYQVFLCDQVAAPAG